MQVLPKQFLAKDIVFFDAMLWPVLGYQLIATYEVIRRFTWRSTRKGPRDLRQAAKNHELVSRVTRRKLAKYLGVSVRQIQKHTNKLRSIGWITVKPGQKGQALTYTLGSNHPNKGEQYFADIDLRRLWAHMEEFAEESEYTGAREMPEDLRTQISTEWYSKLEQMERPPHISIAFNEKVAEQYDYKMDEGSSEEEYSDENECDYLDPEEDFDGEYTYDSENIEKSSKNNPEACAKNNPSVGMEVPTQRVHSGAPRITNVLNVPSEHLKHSNKNKQILTKKYGRACARSNKDETQKEIASKRGTERGGEQHIPNTNTNSINNNTKDNSVNKAVNVLNKRKENARFALDAEASLTPSALDRKLNKLQTVGSTSGSEALSGKVLEDSGNDRLQGAREAEQAGKVKTETERLRQDIKKKREESYKKQMRADRAKRNLDGGTKPLKLRKSIRQLYRIWVRLMAQHYPDKKIPKWGPTRDDDSKVFGQALKLIKMYGLEDTAITLRYMVENWDEISEKYFKNRPKGVPTVGVALSCHDSLFYEAKKWGKAMSVVDEWNKWWEAQKGSVLGQTPDPDLQRRYDKAMLELQQDREQ
jgi:transcriptional regulator with XRE-family HTH domain